MLEMRMPPISVRANDSDDSDRTRSRREGASRRRGTIPVGSAAALPPPSSGRPSARMNRLARSEMRLMGLATTCTAVVCGLLLLYLAAYAHVTQLGVAQAAARTRLRQAQTQNQMLRAERDRLESPQRILGAATVQGMIPRGTTTINYIQVPKLPVQAAPERMAQGPTEWEQGSIGGTTADSDAASFHH